MFYIWFSSSFVSKIFLFAFGIFILSFLSMKDCCFGFPQMLIWGWSSCCFFLLLQIDDEEKSLPLYQ